MLAIHLLDYKVGKIVSCLVVFGGEFAAQARNYELRRALDRYKDGVGQISAIDSVHQAICERIENKGKSANWKDTRCRIGA